VAPVGEFTLSISCASCAFGMDPKESLLLCIFGEPNFAKMGRACTYRGTFVICPKIKNVNDDHDSAWSLIFATDQWHAANTCS